MPCLNAIPCIKLKGKSLSLSGKENSGERCINAMLIGRPPAQPAKTLNPKLVREMHRRNADWADSPSCLHRLYMNPKQKTQCGLSGFSFIPAPDLEGFFARHFPGGRCRRHWWNSRRCGARLASNPCHLVRKYQRVVPSVLVRVLPGPTEDDDVSASADQAPFRCFRAVARFHLDGECLVEASRRVRRCAVGRR